MKKVFDLARQVSGLRRRLGLSQREFGRAIGVSQQQVAKLENGRSGYALATLEKIAERLGLELKIEFRRAHGQRQKKTPPSAQVADPGEAEEISRNIRWFSRLDPCQKIRAVQSLNLVTRRLRDASRKLR